MLENAQRQIERAGTAPRGKRRTRRMRPPFAGATVSCDWSAGFHHWRFVY
jgi:hypothetical protein